MTLSYAGEDIAITSASETMYNERQKLVITGLKSMSVDEKFGLGNAGELLSVSFGLYAEEDIMAADGSVIPADGLIEIIKVTEDGEITAATDLPFGKYYLQEITTHAAYLLDLTKYPVDFGYAGEDVKEVKVMVNSGVTIVNHIYYADIKGIKTDEENAPLSGAVFGLFKGSETDFTKENAIMTATSDKDGYFAFNNVPCGVYKVVELEAPDGYIKSDEVITVTINQGEPVDEMNVVNVDAGADNMAFKICCLILLISAFMLISWIVIIKPLLLERLDKKTSFKWENKKDE